MVTTKNDFSRFSLLLVLLCGSCRATGQAQPVSSLSLAPKATLVSDKEISFDEIPKMMALGHTKLRDKLTREGWTEVLLKDRSLFFSKTLWDQEGYKRRLDFYKQLASAVGKGRVIDPSRSPALSDFVESTFGHVMRFNKPSDAIFALGGLVNVVVSDGQKSVLVSHIAGPSKEIRKTLEAKPVGSSGRRPPSTGREPEPPSFDVPFRDRLFVIPTDNRGLDPKEMVQNLFEAAQVLKERHDQQQKEVEAFTAVIGQKMRDVFGFALDIPINTAVSAVTGPAGDFLRMSILADAEKNGFENPQDAEIFFQNARIVSVQVSWSLIAAAKGAGSISLVTYGLPQ